ncbi:MAG TPA: hypothetical protein VFY05_04425 [Candidatus Angelobacter sp.]|nr:hypothetical protein [Candidatus Angelobacter sp.]
MAILLFVHSLPDPCNNEVGEEILSPDNEWKAVIFERDCGATTDFSTQISLVKGNRSLLHDSSGNIFTADSDHNKVRVNLNGLLPINVIWENNNQLLIRYPARARVFLQNRRYKDVRVSYAADESLR